MSGPRRELVLTLMAKFYRALVKGVDVRRRHCSPCYAAAVYVYLATETRRIIRTTYHDSVQRWFANFKLTRSQNSNQPPGRCLPLHSYCSVVAWPVLTYTVWMLPPNLRLQHLRVPLTFSVPLSSGHSTCSPSRLTPIPLTYVFQ